MNLWSQLFCQMCFQHIFLCRSTEHVEEENLEKQLNSRFASSTLAFAHQYCTLKSGVSSLCTARGCSIIT